MKKLPFLSAVVLFCCVTAFAQKNVAVLEIERRAEVLGDISRSEAMEITNVIRAEAVNTLPRARYSVMTSETVMSMGGAVAADCADENCVITIGRRIDADYIVRGTLSKFRTMFTLNVEMFETDYGNLVATSVPIRSDNLIDILDKSAVVCAEMYKKFLGADTPAAAQAAASPQTAVSPASAPLSQPPAYRLSVSVKPIAGGTVRIDPNLTRYDAGTKVLLTPMPADGYRFTGWSGSLSSESDSLTLTMSRNMRMTANYRRLDPSGSERVAREARPDGGSLLKLTLRISSAALAAGGIVGGIVYDGKVKSEYDKFTETWNYQTARETKENTENYELTRNVLYVLGGIGLSAFTVTLFF